MHTTPCPFCGVPGYCRHFLGWTEDGQMVELARGYYTEPVLPTDLVVPGVGRTSRVYRREVPAPEAANG